MVSTFTDRIHAIYDRHAPTQIHPLIGSTFVAPSANDLRIMALGINSYVSADGIGKESPTWFATWFVKQMYRYQRGAWRDLKAIGEAITKPPFAFASRQFRGMDSLYLTNAIKVYVPEATGKRADQLSDADYGRHISQWDDELDAMAEHGVLPHVIAIIGAPFWPFACRSFEAGNSLRSMNVRPTRECQGECRTFLKAVTVDGPRGPQNLLLLRLRHPAGRTPKGSPRWLLEQAEFAAIASS